MNGPTDTPIDGVDVSQEESRSLDAATDDSKERNASPRATPKRRHGRPPLTKKELYSKTETARYLPAI